MSDDEATADNESRPAVGAPVQPSVRPCAWTARSWLANRSGGHFVPERRHAFDVPLYDQAALDAAVAAERERCAKLCDALAKAMTPDRRSVAEDLARAIREDQP